MQLSILSILNLSLTRAQINAKKYDIELEEERDIIKNAPRERIDKIGILYEHAASKHEF